MASEHPPFTALSEGESEPAENNPRIAAAAHCRS